MADHPTVNWQGASGRDYTYYVWDLPASFNPNQDGNYIYSRRNEQGRWVPIYIGQGDLKDRSTNHHQANCIRQKGATHIHVHLNSRESDRLAEEDDLLARFKNALQPNGCNERPGG